MSVIYETALKTTRQTAVKDAVDSGPAAGKLKIGTAGMATIIATITLNDPSGTVTNGNLTFSGFPKTVAASATGIAAAAIITDSNDNVKVSGLTVGTADSDLIVDNTNVNAGQNFTLNSGSIPHG